MTELTRPMRDFLATPRFAVVATLRADGLPHQTVMWYLLEEDGTLLLNTPAGSRKHRHLQRDPRVSVCIEDGYRYLTLQASSRSTRTRTKPGRIMRVWESATGALSPPGRLEQAGSGQPS